MMTVTPMRSAGVEGEGRRERVGGEAENSKELSPTGMGPT